MSKGLVIPPRTRESCLKLARDIVEKMDMKELLQFVTEDLERGLADDEDLFYSVWTEFYGEDAEK